MLATQSVEFIYLPLEDSTTIASPNWGVSQTRDPINRCWTTSTASQLPVPKHSDRAWLAGDMSLTHAMIKDLFGCLIRCSMTLPPAIVQTDQRETSRPSYTG